MAASNTRAQKAPEKAPEQAPEQDIAPESAPVLDIAAAVAVEEIAKGQRVYVDVPGCPRVPTADGTLATVQREQRADGTLGEFMLAEIRKGKQGNPDSVQRYSLLRLSACKRALDSAGVTII